MASEPINTHGLRIEFGKHRGELWTRVPVSYLNWLVNARGSDWSGAKAIAQAELKRRGSTTPTIEVSGHAIDRASLNCRKIWHQTARDENEGIHAWLCRLGAEALAAGPHEPDEDMAIVVKHMGLKFVFHMGELWPTLKTVMPT